MPHTPGPWICYNQVGNRILTTWRVASDSDDQPCGICKLDESLTGDQQVANARLIAAAPALLEALEAALHDLETSAGLMACDNEEGQSLFQLTHPSTQKARAAIAAARGEGVTA